MKMKLWLFFGLLLSGGMGVCLAVSDSDSDSDYEGWEYLGPKSDAARAANEALFRQIEEQDAREEVAAAWSDRRQLFNYVSPLHRDIATGKLSFVQETLDQGASLDEVASIWCRANASPLLHALCLVCSEELCQSSLLRPLLESREIVKELLLRGATLSEREQAFLIEFIVHTGNTRLEENVADLRYVVNKMRLVRVNFALQVALDRANHLDCLLSLLNDAEDTNEITLNFQWVLEWLSKSSLKAYYRQEGIPAMILNKPGVLAAIIGDPGTHHGRTRLHYAAVISLAEAQKALVGADVDASDILGDTPLHFAVRPAQRPEPGLASFAVHPGPAADVENIISLLVEAGADVNAYNGEGLTPLDVADERCKEVLWELGGQPSEGSLDGCLLAPLCQAL